MPYISQLLNNKISDSTDAYVGKLDDILIAPKEGEFAPLEYLSIKNGGGRIVYVPYGFVENFTSSEISLKTSFPKIALESLPRQNFVRLKKEVLDRQIVDLAGTRVVRVNDLRIGFSGGRMSVLAIDPTFRGIFRRIGLGESFVAKFIKAALIDWRQAVSLEGGPLQLKTVSEEMTRLHPADLANIVEELDVKQGSSLLASLDEREAAKVLEEVEPNLQSLLVKYLGPEKAGKILGQMSSDEVVDLIKTVSEPEAEKLLSRLGLNKAQRVQKLLDYEDNTAGGLMTPDFLSARPDWTVEQATEEIKKYSANFRSLVYVYVTDEEGKFYGVVSLRRILLADRKDKIGKLSKSASAGTLKPGDKIQKIINLMTRYNLSAAAVVDRQKKLLGVVTIDDVMRQLFPSA